MKLPRFVYEARRYEFNKRYGQDKAKIAREENDVEFFSGMNEYLERITSAVTYGEMGKITVEEVMRVIFEC